MRIDSMLSLGPTLCLRDRGVEPENARLYATGAMVKARLKYIDMRCPQLVAALALLITGVVAQLGPAPISSGKCLLANRPTMSGFASDCLYLHNIARSTMGLPPLTWSTSLANHADDWAAVMASSGFRHSGSSGVGENIFETFSGDASCTDAVAAWMAERALYGGGAVSAANFEVFGHYTQVIFRRVLVPFSQSQAIVAFD